MRRNTGENREREASRQRGNQPQGSGPPQSNVPQGGQQQGPPQQFPPQQGQSQQAPPPQQGQVQQAPPPQQEQFGGGQGSLQSQPLQPQQASTQQPQMQSQGQGGQVRQPMGSEMGQQSGAIPQQPQGMGQQAGLGGQQMQQPQGMGQQTGIGGQQMQQPETMGSKPVSATDIIQTDVVTAELDTEIPDLARRMENEDVGSIVVVDGDTPVGIVTDRSIALFCQEMENTQEHTAEHVLSEELISGNTEMTVFEVLEKMSSNDIRRLPILDDEGSLEGIVTLDDLLVLLGTELQKATTVIQSQSSRI